jgi:hypothetical protein
VLAATMWAPHTPPRLDIGPTAITIMEEEDAVLLTNACPSGYFRAQLDEIQLTVARAGSPAHLG